MLENPGFIIKIYNTFQMSDTKKAVSCLMPVFYSFHQRKRQVPYPADLDIALLHLLPFPQISGHYLS